MIRKRKKTALILAAVVLAGVLLLWYWQNLDRFRADRIIRSIENYRSQYDKLPNPNDNALMLKLGFKLGIDWEPHYEILSPNRYKIQLLIGFDGPYETYDSRRGTWEDEF
jgi:hypothetical protein